MDHDQRKEFLQLAHETIAASGAEETEVLVTAQDGFLTRFANNEIHQNVGSRDATVSIRVTTGKRIGVAQVESLEPEALRSALADAQEIASARAPLEDFKRLPGPRAVRPVAAFDRDTAACTADRRADIVAELVAEAKRRNASAAGVVENKCAEILVANSRGVRAYHRGTSAKFQAVVTCGDGSGFAEDQSYAIGEVNIKGVIRDSVGKAVRSRKPRPIEAGEIDVVLEPSAVGPLLQFLAYLGFGAKSFQEGRSFMSGKIGEAITGAKVFIEDNARHPRQRGMPFDFEGVPRKRVRLIHAGKAAAVVYDSYLAGREKGRRQSTGHALPARYAAFGALPMNLVMAGGEDSLKGLIEGTKRGLLVTRFHYVNAVERMKTVLTGMTRDGTFLVENGAVKHPVRNLRFTESVLGAFERIEGLTRSRSLVDEDILCPALKIRGFRFTGTTEF